MRLKQIKIILRNSSITQLDAPTQFMYKINIHLLVKILASNKG